MHWTHASLVVGPPYSAKLAAETSNHDLPSASTLSIRSIISTKAGFKRLSANVEHVHFSCVSWLWHADCADTGARVAQLVLVNKEEGVMCQISPTMQRGDMSLVAHTLKQPGSCALEHLRAKLCPQSLQAACPNRNNCLVCVCVI